MIRQGGEADDRSLFEFFRSLYYNMTSATSRTIISSSRCGSYMLDS
jgi:hypothetical protein